MAFGDSMRVRPPQGHCWTLRASAAMPALWMHAVCAEETEPSSMPRVSHHELLAIPLSTNMSTCTLPSLPSKRHCCPSPPSACKLCVRVLACLRAGACCADVLDAAGICCRTYVDECGVCNGGNTCMVAIQLAGLLPNAAAYSVPGPLNRRLKDVVAKQIARALYVNQSWVSVAVMSANSREQAPFLLSEFEEGAAEATESTDTTAEIVEGGASGGGVLATKRRLAGLASLTDMHTGSSHSGRQLRAGLPATNKIQLEVSIDGSNGAELPNTAAVLLALDASVVDKVQVASDEGIGHSADHLGSAVFLHI